MKTFAQHQKPETFIDQLWSFLDTNKLFSEFDGNSSTNADEEKQLAAAMRASLKDAAAGGAADDNTEDDQHLYTADSPTSSFGVVSSDDDDDGNAGDGDGNDSDDPFAAFDAAAKKSGGSASAGGGKQSGGGSSSAAAAAAAAAAAVEVAKVEVEPVLAPEPAADSAEPVCTIRFVFPDNAKVQRRFLLSEMVWSLYLFVHAQGHRHEIHDLVFGYPKKILDKESAKDVTLESMKMKRETVHVQTIDL